MEDRVFTYRARDSSGRQVHGTVNAAHEAAAVEALRGRGLLVTRLVVGDQTGQARTTARSRTSGKLGVYSLARVSRHLCVLMRAGVGLSDAMATLAAQAESRAERRVLEAVRARVETGNSLAGTLAEVGAFPPLFAYMVEAGETAGRLDDVLSRLAEYYERDYDLRQKVRFALTYPAVVASFTVIVVGILLTFVIPRFVDTLVQSDVPLPAVTVAVVRVGKFAQAKWYLILGVPAMIVFAAALALRTESVRQRFDSLMLRVPGVGKLAEKVIVVRFAETLASLVAAGVPILQSLEIVEKVVGNRHVASGIRRVRSGVREGAGVAAPLAEAGVFPPVVSRMMAVGEESGALDNILTQLAGFYEQEVDRGIKSITSLIEPVVIVFLGLGVALVAASVILPMFQMVQVI